MPRQFSMGGRASADGGAGAQRWAVRHLNFTLNAGELRNVRENEARPRCQAAARLHDPDEGRILLDGFDLRESTARTPA